MIRFYKVHNKIAFKMFFSIGALIMLFGCRQYQLYNYKEIKEPMIGGDISIELRPTFQQLNNKLSIAKKPYSLIFKYSSVNPFKKLEVRNVTLSGTKSEKEIIFKNKISERIHINSLDEKDIYFIITSFSNELETVSLDYGNYSVSALILIHSEDDSIQQKQITYQLETDYSEEKRSDIFDAIMGI